MIVLNVIGMLIGVFSILAGFAGTAGAILLIIAGEWQLVLYLLIASLVVPMLMVIPMLPMFIFGLPAVWFEERGYYLLSNFFGWLGSIYLGLIFAAWSAMVFVYVMNTTETFWGGLLASFGAAIGPIIYMLSKNPIQDEFDSISQTFTKLTCEISLSLMIIFSILYGGTIYEIGFYYLATFAVISIFQITLLNLFRRGRI